MAEKKKFEKPEMQVIQLKSKVHMLSGSCIAYADCGMVCNDYSDDCPCNG